MREAVIINQSPGYYFKAYFSWWYLSHFIHRTRINKIVSFIPVKSFVLDGGCGSGIVPFLLANRKSCSGVGIDIRKECVEFAASKVPGFKFYQGDVREFLLTERFDVVLCMEVLEHLIPADQGRTIHCFDTHLKSGGLLVLTFPSKFYFFIEPVWKLLRKWLYRNTVFDDDECHSLISVSGITQILTRLDYTLECSFISSFGLIQILIVRKR